jgi:hypothetical protein
LTYKPSPTSLTERRPTLSKPRPRLWDLSPECKILPRTAPPSGYTPNLDNPLWIDTGSGSTWNGLLYQPGQGLTNTPPTSDATVTFFAQRSLLCSEGVHDSAIYLSNTETPTFAVPQAGRVQIRLRLASLSTAPSGLITILDPTGLQLTLALNPSGHLQAYTGASGAAHFLDTALDTEGTKTLVTGVNYRLCLTWEITDSTHYHAVWYVNDDDTDPSAAAPIDGYALTGTLATNSYHNAIAVGITTNVAFAGTQTLNFGHLVIDQGALGTDMGDVRTTPKLPIADVTADFPDAIGTSTPPHFTAEAERPGTTSTGWEQSTATEVYDRYTCQDLSTGDNDLSTATLLGTQYYAFSSLSNPETDCHLVHGSSESLVQIFDHQTTVVHATNQSTWSSTDRTVGLSSSHATPYTDLLLAGAVLAYAP